MTKKTYTGINIQWPISELILSGKKTIETRTYPIPEKYLNQEMLMIETPGKNGKFKSRIVAIIIFSNCFKYKTKKEFINHFDKHLVNQSSIWAWSDKGKWGWEIKLIKKIAPKEFSKQKGIVFTKHISFDQ